MRNGYDGGEAEGYKGQCTMPAMTTVVGRENSLSYINVEITLTNSETDVGGGDAGDYNAN